MRNNEDSLELVYILQRNTENTDPSLREYPQTGETQAYAYQSNIKQMNTRRVYCTSLAQNHQSNIIIMCSRANNTTSAASKLIIHVIIKTGEQYNICRIETN